MSRKQPKRVSRAGIDDYGRSPLHNAVIDKDLSAVQAALDSGAEVNARDDDEWTPLHFAAQDHSLAIAKVLLEAGAEIDPQDSNGNTPLSSSVMNSYHGLEFIQFLKTHGADPQIKNHHGISTHDIETDSQ